MYYDASCIVLTLLICEREVFILDSVLYRGGGGHILCRGNVIMMKLLCYFLLFGIYGLGGGGTISSVTSYLELTH